jgi:hypothetical protein
LDGENTQRVWSRLTLPGRLSSPLVCAQMPHKDVATSGAGQNAVQAPQRCRLAIEAVLRVGDCMDVMISRARENLQSPE